MTTLMSIDPAAACWDRVDYGDPCKWGRAPANGTQTPHGTPAPTPSSGGIIPSDWMPDIPDLPDWVPHEAPSATPAPPPPHGGWEPIAGFCGMTLSPCACWCVFLPACL